MGTFDVSLWSAFLAGVATFFAPCILPVLPGFLAFIGGKSEHRQLSRWALCGETLVFALGFTAVFVALGVGVNFLGKPLVVHREIFEKLGGVLIVFFGVFLMGGFSFSWLSRDLKLQPFRNSSLFVQNLVFGLTFGFAWTPCIGPVLGTILFFATGEQTATHGGVLLLFFSLGLTLPFVITALFARELGKILKKVGVIAKYSRSLLGGILVVIGLLLVFGKLAEYSGLLVEKFGTGFVF